MSDDDITPPARKMPRARSEPGVNRDVLIPKHASSKPFGVPIPPPDSAAPEFELEPADGLTPPPMSIPDVVEATAVRVQARAMSIVKRPGPTPTEGALNAALTIHGVRTELKADLLDVQRVLIGELQKDRDVRRQLELEGGRAALESSKAWGELWRGVIWKAVIAAAVVVDIALRIFGK